jgi:hypothetical protein
VIRRLRRHADAVTIFETDIVPYWLALLEWTLPAVIYVQISDWQKKGACRSNSPLYTGERFLGCRARFEHP